MRKGAFGILSRTLQQSWVMAYFFSLSITDSFPTFGGGAGEGRQEERKDWEWAGFFVL